MNPFDERLYTEGILSDDDGFVPNDPDAFDSKEEVDERVQIIMDNLKLMGELSQEDIKYLQKYRPWFFEKPAKGDSEGYW
jgi:hypothetical protein